jgi:hypothetical protein
MTECPSCHTVPPTPHTEYCKNEPWLGHRNLCSSQWSDWCNCGDEPVRLAEQRPEDDPPDPVICDGRNCGGVPHG